MKNFEKYEKEIKEAINDPEGLEPFTLMSKLAGKDILFTTDAIAWLYEDCKEPLLTNEEREYLSTVIKPFRDSAQTIYSNNIYLQIEKGGIEIVSLPFAYTYEFKGLEMYQTYTLEELGL